MRGESPVYIGNPISGRVSILNKGVSVNAIAQDGRTSLHNACQKGHQAVVELLIAHGANINAKSTDGRTPLHMAVANRHQNIIQLLLECGATIEPDIAVMLGDVELIEQFFLQGIEPNSRITQGYNQDTSWLAMAVAYQHKNLVELLLNQGAKVNEKTGTFNHSPLHIAAIGIRGKASLDICQLLIDHGAELNIEDVHGNTPLHWAARLGCLEIVKLLLDCGANVNALDLSRSSPIFGAAQHHNIQVVEYLLSGGVEVNLTDNTGWTPLLRSFQMSGGDEIVKSLVNYGANVNVRGSNGNSPIHIAIAQNNKNIVEFLLANGANVHQVDAKGYTPLHKACTRENKNIVEILIAQGAFVNAQAKDGSTPLYLAASHEHRDIAQLLLDCDAIMEPDIALMLGNIQLVKNYLAQGKDVNSILGKGEKKGTSWLITAIGYIYI